MRISNKYTNYREGAASIYVVIFTALLISVITISFIRIMVGEANRTTNHDLAQSAYDSALAGVEDAKIALLKRFECVADGSVAGTDSECGKLLAEFNSGSNNCDMVSKSLGRATGPEGVLVAIEGADNKARSKALEQYYTCLMVTVNTPDFLGELNPGGSHIVPLDFEDNINAIEISWHQPNDPTTAVSFTDYNGTDRTKMFPTQAEYNAFGENIPSVLRMQLVQVPSSFKLGDFDKATSTATNRATMFLFPVSEDNLISSYSTSSPIEKELVVGSASMNDNKPMPIKCKKSVSSGDYACKVKINLPNPVGGTRLGSASFIRLTSFYKSTKFKVVGLRADGTVVNFDGVQPEIDSTGRANDVYNRVLTRVEFIDNSFPYPEFAVEMSGDSSSPFCKAFVVTDKDAIDSSGACGF